MIWSLRVVLAYAIAFYTYQSTFLSKKLNVEKKLTGWPYPTVHNHSCPDKLPLTPHYILVISNLILAKNKESNAGLNTLFLMVG